ncbi:MAG: hypothetical protein J6T62_04380 [Fibrobacter sp.]|nr:hypothetical protein [Fibrobacter sp.]MBO7550747.1 hypothetical protein [Fibrobacter sp.]
MKNLKYPSTAMVREKLGADSAIAKRIYALEKWAMSHGYDGYKAINRRTRSEKAQQTEMGI